MFIQFCWSLGVIYLNLKKKLWLNKWASVSKLCFLKTAPATPGLLNNIRVLHFLKQVVWKQTFQHIKCYGKSHTGEKPFDCKYCDKCFSTTNKLIKHNMSHTGKKPCGCTQCNKAFSKSEHLERHKIFYTWEKPFGCTQCEKTFSESGSLKRLNNLQTWAKPFGCIQYDKAFFTSNSLKRHTLTHTEEKLFACTHCKVTFSTLDYLLTLDKIHTGLRFKSNNIGDHKVDLLTWFKPMQVRF